MNGQTMICGVGPHGGDYYHLRAEVPQSMNGESEWSFSLFLVCITNMKTVLLEPQNQMLNPDDKSCGQMSYVVQTKFDMRQGLGWKA